MKSIMGRPEDKKFTYYWKEVDDESRQKYLNWFNLRNIEDLFGDDERSTFWKRHINQMKDSKVVKHKGDTQGFFDFGNFVVVEFKENGNAAFVYKKDYYVENLEQFTEHPNKKPNWYFKNKEVCLERIVHRKSWQIKADNLIRRLRYYG